MRIDKITTHTKDSQIDVSLTMRGELMIIMEIRNRQFQCIELTARDALKLSEVIQLMCKELVKPEIYCETPRQT